MAVAAILDFGKILTADWIKNICTKFYWKIHHGHAEMTTGPKVETGSLFA